MSPSVNHPLSSRAALVPAMLVGAASINAAGTVAFFAGFRAEGAAIFAGGIGALPSTTPSVPTVIPALAATQIM